MASFEETKQSKNSLGLKEFDGTVLFEGYKLKQMQMMVDSDDCLKEISSNHPSPT